MTQTLTVKLMGLSTLVYLCYMEASYCCKAVEDITPMGCFVETQQNQDFKSIYFLTFQLQITIKCLKVILFSASTLL